VSHLRAVVSQSSKGLRASLQKHGVPFERPLTSSAEKVLQQQALQDEGGFDESLQELERFETANPGQTKRLFEAQHVDVDLTPVSLLHVDGRAAVQQLFDFLLNHYPRKAEDVPLIHCPTPFLHASVQPLPVLRRACVTKMQAQGGQLRYSLDLGGPVFPAALARLGELLKFLNSSNFPSTSNQLSDPTPIEPGCNPDVLAVAEMKVSRTPSNGSAHLALSPWLHDAADRRSNTCASSDGLPNRGAAMKEMISAAAPGKESDSSREHERRAEFSRLASERSAAPALDSARWENGKFLLSYVVI
jgi:hypothetical protein